MEGGKSKIKKKKKTSQRMAQGEKQAKFERNPRIRNRDVCATDERRTPDAGQKSNTMTSADRVKQS